MQEPIGVEFGQTRVEVDCAHEDLHGAQAPKGDLGAAGAAGASVRAEGVVGGQQEQKKGNDGDEVVVVEVGGFVHRLDVGEGEQEGGGGQAVIEAEG